MSTLKDLMSRYARPGRVAWIGLRPQRHAPVVVVEQAGVTQAGLEGDRGRAGKRAVTLIQGEHLPAIASLAGLEAVAPETLRRNIVVSGLNLTAFRNGRLAIGEALIEITTPCAPCSQMEAALGPGGYNAMRGHGGWCASVIRPGRIRVGDEVVPVADTGSGGG
ncbi:MOSC domain-containing protein [Lutibaculum baratangense]|uniref:MOSC domain protein n=1 Tax=Lutibaculum baratangense AMV1 TaxID=631454 RepID=V4TJM1_9HYPH|nr:MOSC domain-containing protein [Lutibaculum baratangense]ESR26103.1 MOSC domain protein [Lutibaculum baratangense AMV1]